MCCQGCIEHPTMSKITKSMCWGVLEHSTTLKIMRSIYWRCWNTIPPQKIQNQRVGVLKHPTISKILKSVYWGVLEHPYHLENHEIETMAGGVLSSSILHFEWGRVWLGVRLKMTAEGCVESLCLAFQVREGVAIGCQAPASLKTMAEVHWGPSILCFKWGRGWWGVKCLTNSKRWQKCNEAPLSCVSSERGVGGMPGTPASLEMVAEGCIESLHLVFQAREDVVGQAPPPLTPNTRQRDCG